MQVYSLEFSFQQNVHIQQLYVLMKRNMPIFFSHFEEKQATSVIILIIFCKAQVWQKSGRIQTKPLQSLRFPHVSCDATQIGSLGTFKSKFKVWIGVTSLQQSFQATLFSPCAIQLNVVVECETMLHVSEDVLRKFQNRTNVN